ncbi:MAG: hypothetical protein NW208_06620 [Bryobacter sp.]|nr:hypothetical protein [Bryobacter sp.]
MLRIAVIGQEPEAGSQLIPLLKELTGQDHIRLLGDYPDGDTLERFIRASFPRLLVVSLEDAKKAEYIARWMKQFAPGTQVAGMAGNCSKDVLRTALRSGMLECLSIPFERAAVEDLLRLAAQNLEHAPLDNFPRGKVISFLPAKPGVGASTVAMNTASAIAERLEGDGAKGVRSDRVLLADFDLNTGLQGFLLKMDRVRSAAEAGEHAHHMDEDIWGGLVTPRGNLDLLGSGYVNPGARVDPGAVKTLIEFWRRNYGAICVDHSGNLERYSINLLMESDEILLVATPELAPLHLAKARLALLREYGLMDKVSFVVNRANQRDAVTREACEQSVGVKVKQFLPNDYKRLETALYKGTHVDWDSPLGQSVQQLSRWLVPQTKNVEAPLTEKTSGFDLSFLSRIFAPGATNEAARPETPADKIPDANPTSVR